MGSTNTTSQVYHSGGGGGSHIAYGSVNRGTMSGYAEYTNELLVIGGGGGGGSVYGNTNKSNGTGKLIGGTGGGATVGNVMHSLINASGDSQAAALNGVVGQGGSNCGSGYSSGQQRGGVNNVWSGSGGTGYVKSGLTTTSNTAGQRSGNGQARITWVSN